MAAGSYLDPLYREAAKAKVKIPGGESGGSTIARTASAAAAGAGTGYSLSGGNPYAAIIGAIIGGAKELTGPRRKGQAEVGPKTFTSLKTAYDQMSGNETSKKSQLEKLLEQVLKQGQDKGGARRDHPEGSPLGLGKTKAAAAYKLVEGREGLK